MSVDFRHLNRRGEITHEEAKHLYPLRDNSLNIYLLIRFPIKDIHIHRYCPKPNEPSDAANVKR